jgi:hypothetical protein
VHHKLYVRDKEWIACIFSKCWNVWEKMSGEKDLRCGETTPGSSITTMRHLMHCYWFLNFWPARTQLCFLNHSTHLTWLRQTFLISQTEIHVDRTLISDSFKRFRKISRRSYTRSWKRSKRSVSRNGNGIRSGESVQEDSTLKAIRLTQLQACPEKLWKIVPKFVSRPRIREKHIICANISTTECKRTKWLHEIYT